MRMEIRNSNNKHSRLSNKARLRSFDSRDRRYYSNSKSRSRSPQENRSFRERSPPQRRLSDVINHSNMISHAKNDSQQDRRVYVGNLSYEVKWHHLKDFMRQAGNVLFADVLSMPNGRSKGCGIVEYQTREEAQNAVSKLTNQELMGRIIYVREDREAEPNFSQPSRGSSQGFTTPGTQLYVGNLPYSTGWQELKDLFREAGRILRADIIMSYDGRSKGSGIVLFETAEDAQRAIKKFNGYQLGGRALEVREDRFSGGNNTRTSPSSIRSRSTLRAHSEFSDGATGGGEPSDTIFVGNLPWSTADQDLYDLFETVGKVVRAEIQYLPDGKKAGSGVVQFETPTVAEISIAKFSGYNYGRRDLELSYVRRPDPRIPTTPRAFNDT